MVLGSLSPDRSIFDIYHVTYLVHIEGRSRDKYQKFSGLESELSQLVKKVIELQLPIQLSIANNLKK